MAYVLIAAALSWLGMGQAYARTGGTIPCTDKATTTCTSMQEALDIAKSQETATKQAVNYGNTDAGGYGSFTARYASHVVVNEGSPNEYLSVIYEDVAPNGVVIHAGTVFFYWKPKDCSTESDLGQTSWTGVSATTTICKDSCTFKGQGGCIGMFIDGEESFMCDAWKPTGDTCSAGDSSSPSPPDSDGDGSSDGNDDSPNNPGQGGGGSSGKPGQDGSGNPSGGSGTGPNGGQGNGSGEGSGNGNKSGGGGNCASPPASTGDAILAQIAYQTWATRCAVEKQGKEKAEDNGKDTTEVPFNKGDKAEDDSDPPAEVPTHTFNVESMLDMSGFLGGGSCPDFGAITMGPFGTHSLGGQWFCEWLPVFRALIIMMATFTAIKILLGYNS